MRREKRSKRIWITAVLAAVAAVAVIWVINACSTSESPEVETLREPTEAELMDVSGISLTGQKIIIDAGHGGFDQGCTGVSGRLEKEVNLEIATLLEEKLKEEGVLTIMTRRTDDALATSKEEDMNLRKKIILDSNADMFVSIHQNMFEEDPEKAGPQVFYAYHGTAGKQLALAVQDMLNYELDVADPRMALDVAYDVLKPGSQPSCTIECGFFSNPEEEAALQTPEYQEKLVNAIIDGLKLYLKREQESQSTATRSNIPSLGGTESTPETAVPSISGTATATVGLA